jgi:multidrug transporter EmrE-like cation transporter
MRSAPETRWSRGLRLKTYILLFLMVTSGSVGDTVLDKGMKQIGSLDLGTLGALWAGAVHTFANGTVWLGILCMLLFMVCHMLVLSWADYSFVMPFSAIAYALVPLLGHFWLGEPVSATRWAGIGIIVFGVYLISRTPPCTTESAPQFGRAGLG